MIDSSKWKKFQIGALFRKLDLHCKNTHFNKANDVSLERTEEFNLPLVNAKHDNNGIMYYGREADWESAEMSIDIVSDGAASTGDVYAQPQRTGVLYNAYLITPLWECVSEYVLQFLACVIEKSVKSHFGYENKCTWDKVKKEYIFLPVTKEEQPDWDYMESFMKQLMEDSEKNLNILSKTNKTKHLIDTSNWKKFHLYDDYLFGKDGIDMGSKLDKVKMKEIHPSVNFVGRANTNNGITTCVDLIKDLEPYPAGYMTLSLGGEYLGSCFIQPKSFYTSQNVVVLIPNDNMTDNVKRFIATMIFRESRFKYKAFIDELNRHIKTDFSIYLPTITTGEPDWQYMEDYMKEIMNDAENTINTLNFS